MVQLSCLEFKYNSTHDKCTDSYSKCAREVTCPDNLSSRCFVVWTIKNNVTEPLSAGCVYDHDPQGEQCSSGDCRGQLRSSRYYCCCTENLCNANYTTPEAPPPRIPTMLDDPTKVDSRGEFNVTTVISLVIFLSIVGCLVWVVWRKRFKRVNQTYKNNSSSNANNRTSLNGLTDRGLINDGDANPDAISLLLTHPNHHGYVYCPNNHHSVESHRYPTADDFKGALDIINNQSDIRMNLDDIEILELIGSGRFGKVYRAKSKSIENSKISEKSQHQIIVAVKIISAQGQESWLNELRIYSYPDIKHPNIINCLYSNEHVETGNYWLVVEYASKGSLHDYLEKNTVTWDELLRIALGIVHGLSHLHEADRIAHRDFKSKNVLLKHDLTACITDFGTAAILEVSNAPEKVEHRKKFPQVGTPRYMAPEVLECSVTFTNSSFTKIDVYALALVLWELVSRCYPLPKAEKDLPSLHLLEVVPPQCYYTDYYVHHVQTLRESNNPDDNNYTSSTNNNNNIENNNGYSNGQETEHETNNAENQNQDLENDGPLAYQLPFEDIVGKNSDVVRMRQVVVDERRRPPIHFQWRYYPVSEFCRAIEDGWEYDHEARITASCFVERIEALTPSGQGKTGDN